MKAAILEKIGAPLIVDDLLIPELDVGQVLVEVHFSGICGAQIGEINGSKGEDKYLPHLLGHEGSGIVLDIGHGVSCVKPGDHVVLHWRKGAGIESRPPRYKALNGSVIGGGWVTTFNDHAVVSENRLTPYDKDISFQSACLMGCAVTTALGLINNEAKLKIGQTIAVAGIGGVGMNIVQGADMVSAGSIIAIDRVTHKLDLAKKFGATDCVNINNCDMIDEVIKISGKVDVFVDCTGNPDIISSGMKLCKSGGKMILVGQTKSGTSVIFDNMLQHYCGKTLIDSQGGLANPSVDIPKYLNLYKNGKLKLNNIFTHWYPLNLVNDAIQDMINGNTGRCALVME